MVASTFRSSPSVVPSTAVSTRGARPAPASAPVSRGDWLVRNPVTASRTTSSPASTRTTRPTRRAAARRAPCPTPRPRSTVGSSRNRFQPATSATSAGDADLDHQQPAVGGVDQRAPAAEDPPAHAGDPVTASSAERGRRRATENRRQHQGGVALAAAQRAQHQRQPDQAAEPRRAGQQVHARRSSTTSHTGSIAREWPTIAGRDRRRGRCRATATRGTWSSGDQGDRPGRRACRTSTSRSSPTRSRSTAADSPSCVEPQPLLVGAGERDRRPGPRRSATPVADQATRSSRLAHGVVDAHAARASTARNSTSPAASSSPT